MNTTGEAELGFLATITFFFFPVVIIMVVVAVVRTIITVTNSVPTGTMTMNAFIRIGRRLACEEPLQGAIRFRLPKVRDWCGDRASQGIARDRF